MFSEDFRAHLLQLMRWRRDVRRFENRPIPDDLIHTLRTSFELAPSVGLSQPWQVVSIKSLEKRTLIREIYKVSNERAAGIYHGERENLYRGLKLAGLEQAPEQWAVFAESNPSQGHGLGIQTMPEALVYSVVTAIQNLWLTARAYGIGVGWVSIIEPDQISKICDMDDGFRLVAYLCLGYPEQESEKPELEKYHWEKRRSESSWRTI